MEEDKITEKHTWHRLVLGLSGVLIIALVLIWFALWINLEFKEYEWVYSQNHAVKAGQYLLHALWGIVNYTSPLWVFLGVVLSKKMLLPKLKWG